MHATRFLLSIALLAACLAGCSSHDKFDEEPVKANLRTISKAYWMVLSYHRRPPKGPEELQTTLNDLHRLDLGDAPDQVVLSPRDKQPLVIIFGADSADPGTAILAYEQQGHEGSRWVVTMGGDLNLLNDEEFAKATFAKNHKPGAT